MKFASFGALADHFDKVAARLPVAELRILEEIGVAVEEKAKKKLGTYQAGWPALSEATLDDKMRLGFPVPSPLLRTGNMRDRIGHRVTGKLVRIGAPFDTPALFHELGTSKMPARPFIGPAMAESGPERLAIIRKEIARAFRGR